MSLTIILREGKMLLRANWLVGRVPIEDLLHGSLFELVCLGLLVGSVAAFVVALWRRWPLQPPFCSGVFVLALVPFISCALFTWIRLLRMKAWDASGGVDRISVRLQEAESPIRFGFVVSVVLVASYALGYLFTPRPPTSPGKAADEKG